MSANETRAHRPLTGKAVLATHTMPASLSRCAILLAPYGIDLVSAGELHLPEPDETGHMFAENAAIKAHAAAKASGLPRSPMIPASALMRWMARRGCSRPIG